MGLVLLGRTNWGYSPEGFHLRAVLPLLRLFFDVGRAIRNFNIYSVDDTTDLRRQEILDLESLERVSDQIVTHYHAPRHRNASFGGYFEIPENEIKWINFAVQKAHFWLGAEDCISEFQSSKGHTAEENVSRLLKIISSAMTTIDAKEMVGHFRGRLTFFAGEPTLLYRPAILRPFEDSHGYESYVKDFWRMYESVAFDFPRDDVLEIVEKRSRGLELLKDGNILARFCGALDDVHPDSGQVLDDVRRIVEDALRNKGIAKTWQ